MANMHGWSSSDAFHVPAAQCAVSPLSVSVYCAVGGVGLDSDRDLDRASQPMSRATSGDIMGEDEDMPSGLLGSWLLI